MCSQAPRTGACKGEESSASTLEEAADEADATNFGRGVDLDKAWHGIHFVLTGNEDDDGTPLGAVILGGSDVEEDDEEGRIFLEPGRVRAAAEALSSIDEVRFGVMFGQRTWTSEIYGTPDRDYLLGYFVELVEFYQGVAARGQSRLL